MSRKSSLILKRKQVLGSKLNELRNEGEIILKYIENVIDQGTSISRDLETETDHVTFLQRYPVVINKLDRLVNKIVQLNCSIELCASDDEVEESVQNDPSDEEHTLLCNKSAVHNYEVTPENVIQSRADHIGNHNINSFSSGIARSASSINVPSCPVQEGEILDMRYLHGNSPYNFWLCYYTTKSLNYLNETMLTRYNDKQLQPYDLALPYVGEYVCAFDGKKCFRGKVLNIRLGQPVLFMVLDVDSGKSRKVVQDKVFKLDEDLSGIPFQALYCCLHGNLGEPSLWNDQATSLFRQILSESTLVVTVCGKIEGDPPQFLVEVDCHNEDRVFSKIELSKWIVCTVWPILRDMKGHLSDEMLKSLYAYLDPARRDKEGCAEQGLHSSNLQPEPNICSDNYPNLVQERMSLAEISNSTEQDKLHPSTFITGKNEGGGDNLFLLQPAKGFSFPSPPTQASPTSHVRQSSPQKHVKLIPFNNLKNQSITSTVQLNFPTTTECNLSELNLNSPLQGTAKQADGKDQNNLTVINSSSLGLVSFEVGNDMYRKLTSSLLEEKNISLQQPVLISSIGQSYRAMLAHIQDPGEFYIHIVCEENTKIDNLQNQMNHYYNQIDVTFNSKEEANMHIGTFCAAFYDADKQWYRAQVMDWNQNSDIDLVSVTYVDYGNQSSVNFSMLQPLRHEFTELPICARRCHLAMIHPHTSTQDKISSVWSSEAARLFKCLVNMDLLYIVVLMESNDNGICSLPVLLQDFQSDGCTIINKVIVELGYAVSFSPIDDLLYVAQRKEQEALGAEKGDNDSHEGFSCEKQILPVLDMTHQTTNDITHNWDPMSEDFFSEMNTLYHDDQDASYVVTGYKPHDERRICKFYAEKGRCFKGEGCLKEHSRPHPDGWTTDKEFVFLEAFSRLVLPDVRENILLHVTHITKVNLFYAVIRDGCNNSSDRVKIKRVDVEEHEEETEETLVTLNNYLNEEHNVKTLRKLAVTPALGQIVVARFSKDRRFYRARVLDHSSEQYHVLYVDFGNKEWVGEADIRDIEPKYLHLPFQAVDCVLANVDDVSESAEAAMLFANLVYNKTLHAQVIARLDHLSRLEVLLKDENGCDVGVHIIQNGYGKERIYSAVPGNAHSLVG